jgi:GPI mannosyltransferase 2
MAKQRKPVATEMASAAFHDATPANQNIEEDQDACSISILLLPFVLHLAFMAFTALFVMHVQVSNMIIFLVKAKACVGGREHCWPEYQPTELAFVSMQVSTRFLSASPPVYWAAAHVLASPSRASRRWGYLIFVYFIAYILLGSLLFSNFYPFT